MITPASDRASLARNSTTIETHHPDEPAVKPLVTIEASGSWSAVNLRELWLYRELLYFLTLRDIKVRYKQTLLGVAWVVLQPLLTTLVFTLFLGVLVRVPSDGYPYMLFVYAGMLPWTFFSFAISTSGNSLVSNSHLITKVYFPRSLLPISAVAARLLDFMVGFLVLVCLMAYFGVRPTGNALLLPLLIVLITLLALAVGMITSSLNVKYRDVGVLIPVLMQLWMYASPVVYPAGLVPGRWRYIYELNPMTGLIGGFRTAVLGGQINWMSLASATAFIFILLIIASIQFRRMEHEFADIV